jgi:N-acyl-D-aspartate/D-glutamate deacylase
MVGIYAHGNIYFFVDSCRTWSGDEIGVPRRHDFEDILRGVRVDEKEYGGTRDAPSLLAAICDQWCNTLTDVTIDILGNSQNKDGRDGAIVDNIAAICKLKKLETLTFTSSAQTSDDHLLAVANAPLLPSSLHRVIWHWRPSKSHGSHLRVRAAFASRGIHCDNINDRLFDPEDYTPFI